MAGLPNLAATLGGWSARHRLTAVGAWLALVIVAMLLGSMAGQVTMTQAEYGVGESGQATWTLVNAGIKDPAAELVMISSSVTSPNNAAMRSAVSAVQVAAAATGQVSGARAPVTSASGRQVLLQFSMKGDPDTAYNRVQPVEDAVTRVQATHPDVTIEEVGQASVSKWFNDTIFRDFRQAEWTVIPLALGILLAVFGALLAALLPVVLALLGDRNWYLPRWLARFTAGGAGPYPPVAPVAPDGPCQPDGAHPETEAGGRPWIHSSS